MNDFEYYKYWGKFRSDKDVSSYHLLAYHSLDVAAVGSLLLTELKPLTQAISEYLNLSPEQFRQIFCFFLTLHDLGKFASAFQKLKPYQHSKLLEADCRSSYDAKNFRHDRLGWYFWSQSKDQWTSMLFPESANDSAQSRKLKRTLEVFLNIVFGHHGKPTKSGGIDDARDFIQSHNTEACNAFVLEMYHVFQPQLELEKAQSKEWRRKLEQVSWQLAGLTVLADWIGSDNQHFTYKSQGVPLSDYWSEAQSSAQRALSATGLFKKFDIQPYQSIEKQYGFNPTPLQHWAETVELGDQPQLFILEDVTGAGKTEAALALTHRLMSRGTADGFYFGLPTMATSNAMFDRVAQHYLHMFATKESDRPSIVLAHGARQMHHLFREAIRGSGTEDTDYHLQDNSATAQCHQWFADSRKKALLAPVGIGTIDQALMGVLPLRHQSLRLLGLNRKVLIFDEVHAADDYMLVLLHSLLSFHLHQGGSAILLTATLSLKQRQSLTNHWLKSAGRSDYPLQKTDFPLATHVQFDAQNPVTEKKLGSRQEVSRTVKIVCLHTLEACFQHVLQRIEQGQSVVWVRNTVGDAQIAYNALIEKMAHPENCLLFHSRFILQDRKRIEEQVLSIFGKKSSGNTRKGRVLIATQVFQESLDADADGMISDICPIDHLIQRTGRLHRHTRNQQGAYQPKIKDARPAPVLFLHTPAWEDAPQTHWLSQYFPGTQAVYRSPGRLWLTQRKLRERGAIRMPEDARQLIEAVYSDQATEQIPEALTYKENEYIGNNRAKAAKASSQLLKWDQQGYNLHSQFCWHEDHDEISTRYSEQQTVEVLLLKKDHQNDLIPWVNDPEFAVELSTIKLSKLTYADKLSFVPEEQLETLYQNYKTARYKQAWLAQEDPDFGYCATRGFYKKGSES